MVLLTMVTIQSVVAEFAFIFAGRQCTCTEHSMMVVANEKRTTSSWPCLVIVDSIIDGKKNNTFIVIRVLPETPL